MGSAEQLLSNHICSAYCTGGLHCEVAWSNLEFATPKTALLHIGDAPSDQYAYLVWWRA